MTAEDAQKRFEDRQREARRRRKEARARNADHCRKLQALAQSGELEFGSDLIAVAMEVYNAGLSASESGDGELFVSRLWQAYQDAGKPEPVRRWLVERLKDQFLYADKPPVWLGEEPNWAFHRGKPMVFIHQTPEIPQNKVTETHLAYGSVLYIFATRIQRSDGHYRVMYKMIEETPGLRGAIGVQSNPIWIGGKA